MINLTSSNVNVVGFILLVNYFFNVISKAMENLPSVILGVSYSKVYFPIKLRSNFRVIYDSMLNSDERHFFNKWVNHMISTEGFTDLYDIVSSW